MQKTFIALNGAPILMTAGILTVVAAMLHIACIFGGADWYRFMGAGEPMARAVAQGRWLPHAITGGIVTALLVAAAFAFSGSAAVEPTLASRLPFTRAALVAISIVLLVRGLLIFAPSLWRLDLSTTFKFWSSAIVLGLALLYGAGTMQAWPALSARQEDQS